MIGNIPPFYTVDLPYLWGRVTRDGRLIFGAGLATAPSGRLRALDLREGEAAECLARLEARVRGLHPALSGVEVTARWGGPVAFRSGVTAGQFWTGWQEGPCTRELSPSPDHGPTGRSNS